MRFRSAALSGALIFSGILLALVLAELACRAGLGCPRSPQRINSHEGECRPVKDGLGVPLQANCRLRETGILGGETIYDFTSQSDAFGWRTVTPPAKAAERSLVFFGDSITFGLGLREEETLPAQLSRRMPGSQVFNFAWSGFGPQQAQLVLSTPEYFQSAKNAPGPVGIYVFIPEQIERATGAFYLACSYAADFPYYGLSEGKVLRMGNLSDLCPLPKRAVKLLRYSKFYNRFLWLLHKFPPPFQDYEHTAKLLGLIRTTFLGHYPNGRFFVLFYPSKTIPKEKVVDPNRLLFGMLESQGIEYFDYGSMLNWNEPGYAIPGDGHPTARANELVAERLAKDLEARLRLTEQKTR